MKKPKEQSAPEVAPAKFLSVPESVDKKGRDMDLEFDRISTKGHTEKRQTVALEAMATAYRNEDGEIAGIKLNIGQTFFTEGTCFEVLKEMF